MRDVLAILLTLMLGALWVLPAVMIGLGSPNGWGFLYIPIFVVTFGYGDMIFKTYFEK